MGLDATNENVCVAPDPDDGVTDTFVGGWFSGPFVIVYAPDVT